jgi:hypothetical protein
MFMGGKSAVVGYVVHGLNSYFDSPGYSLDFGYYTRIKNTVMKLESESAARPRSVRSRTCRKCQNT